VGAFSYISSKYPPAKLVDIYYAAGPVGP